MGPIPQRRIALLLLACGFCAACEACQREEVTSLADLRAVGRAHVVLISIDTLRRDHLTFYGYPKPTSPQLQRIADQGIVFEDAIAAHALTAPSHASMLTGLSPTTHGIMRNGMTLREEVPTLQAILSDAGYRTGAFISGWTMGRTTGLQTGFDVYDAPLNIDATQRTADLTWAQAEPWLREAAGSDSPFFLFLHFYDPHFRYEPPEEYARRFLPEEGELLPFDEKALRYRYARVRLSAAEVESTLARYDGEIAFADHHVGLLLDALGSLRVLDDTLIVFLSDHGETLDERAPVFDHGSRLYDEQIRVPLVIRLPGAIKAGTRVRGQVHHIDVMPTLLDALALPAPAGASGQSLLPAILTGEQGDSTRALVSNARSRWPRVPHIRRKVLYDHLVWSLRLSKLKLIEYPTPNGWYPELFNLEQDPGEVTNLARRDTALTTRLHRQLQRWRERQGAAAEGPLPELSPEIEAGLRALGYVD